MINIEGSIKLLQNNYKDMYKAGVFNQGSKGPWETHGENSGAPELRCEKYCLFIFFTC